jgi:hypothetical protein
MKFSEKIIHLRNFSDYEFAKRKYQLPSQLSISSDEELLFLKTMLQINSFDDDF